MVVILLLTATVFVTHLALAKEESIGLANESLTTSSNKTEFVSFVESAVAYAQENGKDKALDEFSNKTGLLSAEISTFMPMTSMELTLHIHSNPIG